MDTEKIYVIQSDLCQHALSAMILFAVGSCASIAGFAQEMVPADLTRMDMEDLMNIKVTSVSKRDQKLSRAAAAVYVINQEDIRGSGAANIADLLRMAPGVNVERIDANAWAISVRGFNSRYSNKVLVLIDGRTVYSPAFSGVYWDHLDMPLENIERIEVIRGPGGTVWGANAVNGVISIITKSSEDTTGGLITAGGGSQLNALGQVQYGGEVTPRGTYRVFGRYFGIGNSAAANGSPAHDNWRRMTTGFRSDWNITDRDSLMVQGTLFANQKKETLRFNLVDAAFEAITPASTDAAGGNLLARWSHTFAGGSQVSLQSYYDTYRRTDYGLPEVLRTFDLDFQHNLTAGDRHDIVWGINYRANTSILSPGYVQAFSPSSRTDKLYSAFLQDEIRLSQALSLTIGLKVEHNAYTGAENEPSVRLMWNRPGSRHTLWTSASRAIRQPARSDSDLRATLATFPLGPDSLALVRLYGNPNLRAEEICDYEIGYRAELHKKLYLDVATFLSFYRRLATYEQQATEVIPGSPVQFVFWNTFGNNGRATNYGGEISLNWKANSRWRISPGYAYLHSSLRLNPPSAGPLTSSATTDFPTNTFQFRSMVNLSRKMEFNQSLYYAAKSPEAVISGRTRLDLVFSRRLGEGLEVSVVGQDLLRPAAFEYGDSTGLLGTQTRRSVYGKITWTF